MKIRIPLTSAFFLLAGALILPFFGHAEKVSGPGANWLVDFQQAQKKSAAENKPIFLYFTGSTWCPPCMLTEKEILLSKPFIEYSSRELILVKADFSRSGEAMAKEHQEQHRQLYDTFADGFPTVALIAPDGKLIEKFTGYRAGGGEKFVVFIRNLIKEAGFGGA